MTIIILILVLLAVVLVHEWGHFFVAKKSNMQVDEFGFGIPPRIWSWKNKNTVFSLNALPIGGFVKIAGEQPDEKRNDVKKERLFVNRPRYQQALVLVAGVVCNFLFGWLLFSFAYGFGIPEVVEQGIPQVLALQDGGPAQTAGLIQGDKLLKATIGRTIIEQPKTLALSEAFQKLIPGQTVIFSIERNGEKKEIEVVPELNEATHTYSIGITSESIKLTKYPPHVAFAKGLQKAVEVSVSVTKAFGSLFVKIFQGHGGLKEFIGPVGLAGAVKDAAKISFPYFLFFVGFISLNLGVLNLMPFPALDGGRLLIVFLEAIFRKKFNPKVIATIHLIGFGLLLILMALLIIQDIRRLV